MKGNGASTASYGKSHVLAVAITHVAYVACVACATYADAKASQLRCALVPQMLVINVVVVFVVVADRATIFHAV